MNDMNRRTVSRLQTSIAGVALMAFAAPVFAQTPPLQDSWQFSAGVGVASRPKYPGSSESKTQAVPLLGASYGRYFIGSVPAGGVPFGLGAYLYRDDQLRVGLAIGAGGFSKTRKESDDARLRGLGDIDGTTRAVLFSSYTIDWFSIRNSISADIGNEHQGIQATLDLEGKYHVTPSLAFTAGPGLTWADSDYTQTFFGIDSEQSARSGLPQYMAKSGLNTVRFSVGAEYMLSKQWMLAARATAARLRGDAVDSPITADKSQNAYGVFVHYRF